MVTLSDQVSADLTQIFSVDDLAETITITKSGGGVLNIPAHFEKSWVSAGAAEWGTDIGAPQEIFVPHPSAFVKTSDIPGVAKGDQLTANSENFKIRELQDDGTGITEIILWQP